MVYWLFRQGEVGEILTGKKLILSLIYLVFYCLAICINVHRCCSRCRRPDLTSRRFKRVRKEYADHRVCKDDIGMSVRWAAKRVPKGYCYSLRDAYVRTSLYGPSKN